MPFVPDAVPEEVLDYDEILRRGGQNYGDEDFALCKCPHCGILYLLEYEVDTIYLDATDLSKRLPIFDYPRNFDCLRCGGSFPATGSWIGPKAPPEMQVTWAELAASDWYWATQRTRESHP